MRTQILLSENARERICSGREVLLTNVVLERHVTVEETCALTTVGRMARLESVRARESTRIRVEGDMAASANVVCESCFFSASMKPLQSIGR